MQERKISLIVSILKQRKYATVAIITSIGFGLLHYYLSMAMLAEHFSITAEAMPVYLATSLSLSAVIAALAGINVALVVYKNYSSKQMNLKKTSGSTLLGGGLAVFTPGCPACTTPLIVILGAVGGLAIFPLQGLELKLISVAALAFATYWISRGLNRPSCCSMRKQKLDQ